MTNLRQEMTMKKMFFVVLATSLLSFTLPVSAQYSLEERLANAVRTGNVEAARELLDKGADINAPKCAKGLAYITPLQCAATYGQTEIVKLLLERGANLEIKDNEGRGDAALAIAVKNHNIDVTKLLLAKGADVNASDRGGETALFYAVDTSYVPGWSNEKTIEMVKLLLNAGADVDAETTYGSISSPLKYARGHGPAELVDLLEQTRRQRKLEAEMAWLSPQAKFEQYLRALQQYPGDELMRGKVIQLCLTLPEFPKTPDEARQLFLLGTSKIKLAKSVPELAEPVTLLRKATDLAPCWANAYYNLASALDLSGKYDDATTALNHYLELRPPEAEAHEARSRLATLQTLKDAAIKSAKKR
ncbi:MAG: hypothetical protein CXZ00_12605 [Acidobacteria bacterium]|nr:MAG: hypothetical protein CXZ00_12605 [Acidobacteriota bacterium]